MMDGLTGHHQGEPLMIKASGRTGNGKPLLFFGLSGENVTRLIAGEPIHFNLRETGLPIDAEVVIAYGKTEDAIKAELAEHGVPVKEAKP